MPKILVGTYSGCRVFTGKEEPATELPGRYVSSLTAGDNRTCLAVIDQQEIWQRSADGRWSKIAAVPIRVQSLTAACGLIFCGGADEAAIFRISHDGKPHRLQSFDKTPGRNEWFAGGPPLGVRSLTKTADHRVILAAIHVGGIPRSEDNGETWAPTIPVLFDVHEICAHPSDPRLVGAATAVGLCVSQDAGQTWKLLSEGLDITNSLAVAVVHDEFLFGISDGPFAKKSQLWRCPPGHMRLELVTDGLPDLIEGKIDTGQIAGGDGCAALVDGAGTLWHSETGSRDWTPLAKGLPYPSSLLLL